MSWRSGRWPASPGGPSSTGSATPPETAAAPKRGRSTTSLSLTEVDGRALARPEAFGQVVVLRARDPRETPGPPLARPSATSSTELLAHDVDEAASAFALAVPNVGARVVLLADGVSEADVCAVEESAAALVEHAVQNALAAPYPDPAFPSATS